MNKRMLELYRQAKVPHTAIDPSNNMPYETSTFSAEKFAELIVKECLSVVESYTYGPAGQYDYSYSDADAAADRRAESIHDNIKYRFGVEE